MIKQRKGFLTHGQSELREIRAKEKPCLESVFYKVRQCSLSGQEKSGVNAICLLCKQTINR